MCILVKEIMRRFMMLITVTERYTLLYQITFTGTRVGSLAILRSEATEFTVST